MANVTYTPIHINDTDTNRIQNKIQETVQQIEAVLNDLESRIKELEKQR